MDRERAEAHLRMLAEDEMRHAMLPDRWGIRVSRVAQALTAVGALDDETAKRILDEVELARALRHPDPAFRRHLSRAGAASLMPYRAPRRGRQPAASSRSGSWSRFTPRTSAVRSACCRTRGRYPAGCSP